jgi:hypothetical protein
MAGPKWKLKEKVILIRFNKAGFRDQATHEEMKKMDIQRTLEGIRSELCQLRRNPDLFDRENWKWKDDGVQRLCERAIEEELQEHVQDDDEGYNEYKEGNSKMSSVWR